jgi:hypothetical protein
VVADVVGIGQDLSEVKQRLDHGHWLPWLQAEFGWAARTAQGFMRVHQVFKSAKFSHLAPVDVSALYLLAAPSTPETAREAARELAAEGQPVKHAQARAAVDAQG